MKNHNSHIPGKLQVQLRAHSLGSNWWTSLICIMALFARRNEPNFTVLYTCVTELQ